MKNMSTVDKWSPLVNNIMRIDELIDPNSDQFQRWFKNSKVVDKNGDPQVMYHATDAGVNFKTFKPMSHFGTMKTAHDVIDFHLLHRVARAYGTNKKDIPDPVPLGGTISDIPDEDKATELQSLVSNMRIIPVYLSIKNPMVLKDTGLQHSAWNIVLQMADAGIIDSRIADGIYLRWNRMFGGENKYWNDGHNRSSSKPDKEWDKGENIRMGELVRIIKKFGYDGFYYRNTVEGKRSISWVPLTTRQVRFAI